LIGIRAPRKLVVKAAVVFVATLTCLSFLIPVGFSVFYERRAGEALKEAAEGFQNENAFPCASPSLSDPSRRSLAQKAVIDLQKTLSFQPRMDHPRLLLGEAYCLLGEPEKAVDVLKDYTLARPQNPLGHAALGFVYQASGDVDLAIIEWGKAHLQTDYFLNAWSQTFQLGFYSESAIWLDRARLVSRQPADDLSAVPGQEPILLDGFLSAAAWEPCSWCENSPGAFQAQNGLMKISYRNIPGKPSGFAIRNLSTIQPIAFKELFIRVKGGSGVEITIEITQGSKLSRPIAYQPIGEDWTILSIPLDGTALEQILVGIGNSTLQQNNDQYSAEIDWISIR